MTNVVNQEHCSSLTELQERHEELVETSDSNAASSESVERFIEVCQAMGHILDAPADRSMAQSLITYWVNRRSRQARRAAKHATVTSDNCDLEDPDAVPAASSVDSTSAISADSQASTTRAANSSQSNVGSYLLCEFQQSAFDDIVVAPTNTWLDQLSAPDHALVGQIVLRLMTLKADGTFEFVPATQLVLEGLPDAERAKQLLDKLVRLGIVRRQRRSLDLEEYTLPPLQLLSNWESLKQWMTARTLFRDSAKKTLQWQLAHSQTLRSRPWANFWRTVRTQMTHLGARMQEMHRSVFGKNESRSNSSPTITEQAMREAEYYHDKNSDEMKVLYLQRQMDRFESEINQERLFGVCCMLGIFFALALFALSQWRVAARQTVLANMQTVEAKNQKVAAEKAEEKARHTAQVNALLIADRSVASARRTMYEDPAGAWLQGMHAYFAIEDNKSVLPDPTLAAQWTKSNLLSVSCASSQSPVLLDMLLPDVPRTSQASEKKPATEKSPNSDLLASVSTLTELCDNGEVSLQINALGGELLASFCSLKGDGSWHRHASQPLPLPAIEGKLAGQPLTVFFSPDGQHAAVLFRVAEPASTFVFVRSTPLTSESGPTENNSWKLLGEFETTSAPAFESNGKYFGLVENSSGKHDKSHASAIIWTTEDWHKLLSAPLPVDGRVSTVGLSRESVTTRNAGTIVSIRMAIPVTLLTKGVDVQQLTFTMPRVDGANRDRLSPQSKWEQIYTIPTFDADTPLLLLYSSQDPNILFCSNNGKHALVRLGPNGATRMLVEPAPQLQNKESYCKVCAFSPDGSLLALGFRDGQVAVWDVDRLCDKEYELARSNEDGLVRMPSHPMHSEEVFGVRFSPDSKYLISCSRDKLVQIYDLCARRLAAPPLLHNATINTAKATEDGRFLTTLTRDTLYSWEFPAVRTPVQSWGILPGRTIATIAVSTNGVMAIGGSRHEADVSCGWIRRRPAGDSEESMAGELVLANPVQHLSIDRDGRWLCAIDQRGRATLFHESKLVWSENNAAIHWRFAAFDPYSAEPRLLLGGEKRSVVTNSVVQLLEITKPTADQWAIEEQNTFEIPAEGQNNAVVVARFDPWKIGCFVGTETGRIYACNSERKSVKPLSLLGSPLASPHKERVTQLAFHDQTRLIVSGSEDDRVTCWQVSSGQWESSGNQLEKANGANISFLAISPSGKRMASASADGRAVIWQRTVDGEQPGSFQIYHSLDPKWYGQNLGSAMVQTDFVPGNDERYLFCRWNDRTAQIFDILKIADPISPDQMLIDGKEIASFAWSHEINSARLEIDQQGRWVLSAEGFENFRNDSEMLPDDRSGPPVWDCQVHMTRQLINPLPQALTNLARRQPTLEFISLISGRNSQGLMRQLAPIPPKEVPRLWESARVVHKDWPDVPGPEPLDWHRRELKNSLNSPSTAKWHLERLQQHKGAVITPLTRLEFAMSLGRFKSSYQQALDELKLAESQLNQAPDYLSVRATIRSKLGALNKEESLIEGAIQDYQQILAVQPQDVCTRVRLVNALIDYKPTDDSIRQKRLEESLAQLNSLIQPGSGNQSAALVKKRGVVHAALKHYQLAITDMTRAGDLFQRAEDYEQACGEYLGALALLGKGESDHDIRAEQAALYVKLGDTLKTHEVVPRGEITSASEAYFKACQIEPNNLNNMMRFFKSLPSSEIGSTRMYTWTNVNDMFETAMSLEANNVEIYRERIRFLLPKARKAEDLDQRFELVFETFETMESESVMILQDYLDWAATHVYRDQLAQAEQVLTRCQTKFPGFSIVDVRLGLVLALQHKDEDLKKLIEAMRSAKDNSSDNKNNIAWVSLFSDQPVDDLMAIVKLAESIDRPDADDPAYLNTLGAVYARAGRYREALGKLNEATQRRKETLDYLISRQEKLYGNAIDLLFAAMAHRGQHNHAEADDLLHQAQERFALYNNKEPSADFSTWVWNEREFQLFADQAKPTEEL